MSLYKIEPSTGIYRGAIYKYLPIFWLESPLWIIRTINWTKPITASLQQESDITDSFSLATLGNEEDVLARAKRRFIVVVSPNYGIGKLKDILVAPIYSIEGKGFSPEDKEYIKNNPSLFYLEHDGNYSEIKESFIDFKQVRPLRKDFFFPNSKLRFSFDTKAMDAILNRFIDYITMTKLKTN